MITLFSGWISMKPVKMFIMWVGRAETLSKVWAQRLRSRVFPGISECTIALRTISPHPHNTTTSRVNTVLQKIKCCIGLTCNNHSHTDSFVWDSQTGHDDWWIIHSNAVTVSLRKKKNIPWNVKFLVKYNRNPSASVDVVPQASYRCFAPRSHWETSVPQTA